MHYHRFAHCLAFAALVVSWFVIATSTGAQEAARAQESVNVQQSTAGIAEPRSLAELTKDSRAALRGEATLTEPEQWETAVRALVALNEELRAHPKNREGSSFERLKRSVRRRLLKAQKKLARQQDKLEPDERALVNHPLERLSEGPAALAQQAGGFRPVGGAGIGGRGGFGGAAGAGFAGAAGALGDYGEDLVELIESTINADIWQSVGGPAAMIYYQPSQALIISAPANVHEEVSDLLRQLRAAGGP
jgi:hypothetical protein